MMTADLTHRRQEAARHPAAVQERLLLRARRGDRQAAAAPIRSREVNWANGVDMKTGRPSSKPEARYRTTSRGISRPACRVGTAGTPNAYSPDTGLIYIPTQEAYFPMVQDPNYKPSPAGYNLGIAFGVAVHVLSRQPELRSAASSAACRPWIRSRARGVADETTNQGPTGGALATAGNLVFQGTGSSAGAPRVRCEDGREAVELRRRRPRCSPRRSPMSWMASSTSRRALAATRRAATTRRTIRACWCSRSAARRSCRRRRSYTPLPLDPPRVYGAGRCDPGGRRAVRAVLRAVPWRERRRRAARTSRTSRARRCCTRRKASITSC